MQEIKLLQEGKGFNLIGIVDNQEIIHIHFRYNRKFENPWFVGQSLCLPTNIEKAEKYLKCLNDIFHKYNEIKNCTLGGII